jgi:hypothetical protein
VQKFGIQDLINFVPITSQDILSKFINYTKRMLVNTLHMGCVMNGVLLVHYDGKPKISVIADKISCVYLGIDRVNIGLLTCADEEMKVIKKVVVSDDPVEVVKRSPSGIGAIVVHGIHRYSFDDTMEMFKVVRQHLSPTNGCYIISGIDGKEVINARGSFTVVYGQKGAPTCDGSMTADIFIGDTKRVESAVLLSFDTLCKWGKKCGFKRADSGLVSQMTETMRYTYPDIYSKITTEEKELLGLYKYCIFS